TAKSPSATTQEMRDGRRRARPSLGAPRPAGPQPRDGLQGAHPFRWLFHNDLAVLPGVGQTDVVVVARLREGDGLRLAFDQHARVELAPIHRGRRVWEIADVGEGYGRARLDAD